LDDAGGLYRQIYELQLRDQERFINEMEALGAFSPNLSDDDGRELSRRME
jgi:hypothetical protein